MRNKRIAVSFLVLLMIGALALPVFARGPICTECVGGELKQDPTEYSSWKTTENVLCQKNPMYTDKKQQRTVTTSWTCNNCGVSTINVTTETRILCEH